MNDYIRHTALSQMCKAAEAARLYSKVMQKVAEHRPRPSDAYIAGFCKAAEDAGVDPEELVKLADWSSWWRDKWNKAKFEAQNAWAWGKGLVGAFGDKDLYEDAAKNVWTGAKSMGTGIAQGAAALPGLVGNVAGGVGGLVAGAFMDGNYLDNVKRSWNAGGKLVDSIGIGDYDLKHLKDRLDTVQANNRSEYMANNNMDPNNMGALERWGMNGMAIANGAGKAIPAAYVGAKVPGLKWTSKLGGKAGGTVTAITKLQEGRTQGAQDIASAQQAQGAGQVKNNAIAGSSFMPPSSFNNYPRVQFNV